MNLKQLLFLNAAGGGGTIVEETATGNPATIETNLAKPIQVLTVGIEPVQSGSGDPSPSNVRPISGWTGANVERTGVNVCYKVLSNAISLYPQDNNRSVVLASAGTSACFKCVKGQTYTVSGATGRNRNMVSYYDTDPVVGSVSVAPNTAIIYPVSDGYTFTAEYTGYAACYLANSILSDVNIQIELGSTASTYETYHGSSTSYPFPSSAGTVYGGTLTVNSDGTGSLVVDKGIVDLGSLTWAYSELSLRFEGSSVENMSHNRVACICSQYVPYNVDIGWADKNNVCCIYDNRNTVFVKDLRYTDAATFKTAMSGVQLVYELKTPVVYNLTDLEVIELLKGTNNLWADTNGTNTIKYLKKST